MPPRFTSYTSPGAVPDAAGRFRTYVVFGYATAFGAHGPVVGLGTVRARDLATARALGDALAADRGHPASPEYAVRTWRASACRPAWLWRALENDGATLLTRARGVSGKADGHA